VAEADEAKSDGIRVMSIALGTDANDSLMKEIASDPDSTNFFDAPQGADLDSVFRTITDEICPTIVEINIKPGSDPNAVNCGSEVVPVAVLTTSDFDATTVDPASLRFGAPQTVVDGDGAGIVHDSVPEREYEETLDKGRALVTALDEALGEESDLEVEGSGRDEDEEPTG
jgi:hypothetical protein